MLLYFPFTCGSCIWGVIDATPSQDADQSPTYIRQAPVSGTRDNSGCKKNLSLFPSQEIKGKVVTVHKPASPPALRCAVQADNAENGGVCVCVGWVNIAGGAGCACVEQVNLIYSLLYSSMLQPQGQ